MTVSEISLKAIAEAVARADACSEPDSIEITILAMLNKAVDASREIVLARSCGHKLNRDKVRRPLVDVAAAALLMVTRIDAGDWCDVRNTQGGETDE